MDLFRGFSSSTATTMYSNKKNRDLSLSLSRSTNTFHRTYVGQSMAHQGLFITCKILLLRLLELENGIFRAWWLEPLVTTLSSFAAAIHFFWYHERRRGLTRCHQNNFWKEMNMFGQKVGGGGGGDLTNSLLAYWIGIFILRMMIVVPAQQHRPDGIPKSFNDGMYLLGEVVSGIMVYDALFFVLHWLMHNVHCLHHFHCKHHHHHHHHHPTVEARDVLRHSLDDGTLQVLCNILAQQQCNLLLSCVGRGGSPKSRLAQLLHNVLVTWMLTESHTSSPEPNVFRCWFVGVRQHQYHHHHHHHHDSCGLRPKKHQRRGESYQQFFGYLDRAWEAYTRHEMPPPPSATTTKTS
jgi:hypothetical protein